MEETIQHIQVIIDMVAKGQSAGVLTLEQGSDAFLMIQEIKSELGKEQTITEKVLQATQKLVNMTQLCQKAGAYTLENAHLIVMSIKKVQEFVQESMKKKEEAKKLKTLETEQVLKEKLPTIKE